MAAVPAIDFGTLLKDIPRGAWVAISSDYERVVSYGAELRTVLEDAKSAGEPEPILARVPESPGSLFL
ncbi:MAG: hypothetical protein ABSF98_08230 [Bryobacteraceae bacterium]|jgi:hypothetical protein